MTDVKLIYNKVMNVFMQLLWRQPNEFISTYLKFCVHLLIQQCESSQMLIICQERSHSLCRKVTD